MHVCAMQGGIHRKYIELRLLPEVCNLNDLDACKDIKRCNIYAPSMEKKELSGCVLTLQNGGGATGLT